MGKAESYAYCTTLFFVALDQFSGRTAHAESAVQMHAALSNASNAQKLIQNCATCMAMAMVRRSCSASGSIAWGLQVFANLQSFKADHDMPVYS